MVGVLFFASLLFASILAVTSFLVVARALKETFDPLLYNEKYFNVVDAEFFNGFPFGFARIASYALCVVITRPKWYLRRYKGFNFRCHVSHRVYVWCIVFTIGEALALLTLLIGIPYGLFMRWKYGL